jgi:hypothetical protein
MKAFFNDKFLISVEGTPEEIAQFLSLKNSEKEGNNLKTIIETSVQTASVQTKPHDYKITI